MLLSNWKTKKVLQCCNGLSNISILYQLKLFMFFFMAFVLDYITFELNSLLRVEEEEGG